MQRLRAPTLAEGALTHMALATYCRGRGVEVGPGIRPYGPTGTIFVDRLHEWTGAVIQIDAISDAVALPFQSRSLDYLISSHCLEHCADTLAVLEDWVGTLRTGGNLVLILPHCERTFDEGRIPATFEHHAGERGTVDPFDDAHWSDFEGIALSRYHSWKDDPSYRNADGSWNRLAVEAMKYIHYHVWTQHEMTEILCRLGLRIRLVVEDLPERHDSFLVVASRD